MSVFKKLWGSVSGTKATETPSPTESASKQGASSVGEAASPSPTTALDRGEILKQMGDTSNYNKLPETVQLDRKKVKELLDAERSKDEEA